MAKQKPIVKIEHPIYEMKDLERFMDACKAYDYTGEQLIKIAVDIFLKEHGF